MHELYWRIILQKAVAKKEPADYEIWEAALEWYATLNHQYNDIPLSKSYAYVRTKKHSI